MGAGVDDVRASQVLRAGARTAAFALIASLLITGGVVAIVCEPPLHPLHAWRQILLLATSYALLAFFVHSVVVWAVCRICGERRHAGPLVLELWNWVAWLPLLALLTGERSIWVALVLPGMAASATMYIRRRSSNGSTQETPETTHLRFLQVSAERPFVLSLLPMLLTSVLLQTGAVLLGARDDWFGGTLLAGASIVPMWRVTRSRTSGRARNSWRPAANSVVVLLLMALVLVPFLQHARSATEVDTLLHRAIPGPPAPVVQAKARTDGTGFSGIVLLLPSKPHEHKLPPPPVPLRPGMASGPIVIPFDGAYWYLKAPLDHPEPDARIEHGDPLKAKVRSTNMLPVLMKAHQALPTPMKMSCCTSLRVELVNAEPQPGPIYVEVHLGLAATPDTSGTSLGKLLLSSSQSGTGGSPIHETLTFTLPHMRPGQQFDDITVSILPNGARALTGSRISVQSFTFVP